MINHKEDVASDDIAHDLRIIEAMLRDDPSYKLSAGVLDRAAVLIGQLAAAQEALNKYGRHERDCALYLEQDKGKSCDCGFADAATTTQGDPS